MRDACIKGIVVGDFAVDDKDFYNAFYRVRTRPRRALRDLFRVSEHMIKNYVLSAVDRYHTPNDGRIIDLGCGRGQLTHKLSRFGSTMGIDYSQTAVDFCREAYPLVRFEVGDIFEDRWLVDNTNSFDLVVSTEVIEHIPVEDQQRFVRNCVAMCVNGGLLILTTPCRETVDIMRSDYEISEDEYYRRHEGQPTANLLFARQLAAFIPGSCEILEHTTLAPYITPRWLDILLKFLSMPTMYHLMNVIQKVFGYPGRVQAICIRVKK